MSVSSCKKSQTFGHHSLSSYQKFLSGKSNNCPLRNEAPFRLVDVNKFPFSLKGLYFVKTCFQGLDSNCLKFINGNSLRQIALINRRAKMSNLLSCVNDFKYQHFFNPLKSPFFCKRLQKNYLFCFQEKLWEIE